jgi:hypothetical protein
VLVFAALADTSYEDVLADLPGAHLGTVTVDGWIGWLQGRGWTVTRQDGCPTDIVPCAHLVAPVPNPEYCHWVYRDSEGDVHDPTPVSLAMPADSEWMRNLKMYDHKILTVSVSWPDTRNA